MDGRDRRCGLAGTGGLKDTNSKAGVPVAVTDHLGLLIRAVLKVAANSRQRADDVAPKDALPG